MKTVRWWPAALIVGLALLWLGRVWLLSEAIRQDKFLQTVATSAVALVLLLVWLLLLSRLPWRARLGALAAVLAVIGLAVGSLRIRGVSGDVVPIFEWRWRSRAASPATPAVVQPAPAEDGGPKSAPPAAVSSREPHVDAPSAPGSGREDAGRPAPTPSPAPASSARDYPQFLGPDRDGTVRGLRLDPDWSARPPRPLWRHPIGAGWSGFAVAGRSAVTQEQQGEDELVASYDLGTGALLWRHADKARYDTVIAGEGPRATPTIDGRRVFTMGSTGTLDALDLATGHASWTRNVVEDNAARNPQWGRSCSPLVLGALVIVSAGGPAGRSLVAYDGDSGRPVWAGGNDGSGYSSPFVTELAGLKQILIFNNASVAAHDPATGALVWEQAWPDEQPNVSQPLPLPGDRVLVSAGYGVGSKLFQISRGDGARLEARLVWESPRLKAKFTNLVFHEGYVYGLDDGVLTCLDPASGERKWRAGRYGHGQVILVGDLLLVQTEEGEIVLVRPDPSSLVELGRFAALEGKTWNPPALAGSRLLVRNDREAAAYELPLLSP